MQPKWMDAASLRELAVEALARRTQPPDSGRNRDALLHELLVHQTELEMQNEALREAQDDLSRSEERYKDLFDNAPIGYVLVDAGARIFMANPRACEMLGCDPKGVRGTRVSQYLPAEEATTFELHRREVLSSQGRLAAQFTILEVEGRTREVRFDSLCTDAASGQWRIAMTDVTLPNDVARRPNQSAQKTVEPITHAEDAPPAPTAMIVERNPEARALIERRLRGAGCEVAFAANGLEALELLGRLSDRVSLVLLDEQIPSRDIQELLRAIRAMAPAVEILVAPLTSTNESGTLEETIPNAVMGVVSRVQSRRRS